MMCQTQRKTTLAQGFNKCSLEKAGQPKDYSLRDHYCDLCCGDTADLNAVGLP